VAFGELPWSQLAQGGAESLIGAIIMEAVVGAWSYDTAHFIGETQAPFHVQTVDVHFDNHLSTTGANPFVPNTVVMHLSCA